MSNTTYLSARPGAGVSDNSYRVEEGVLVDAADTYDRYSRSAVEADFPIDFRGGGPDPRVDTETVTVRYRS